VNGSDDGKSFRQLWDEECEAENVSREKLKKGFGKVERQVMQDRNLSVWAKALYAVAASYTFDPSTVCDYPSQPTLKSLMGGCANDTFSKACDELVKSGYWRVTRGKGRAKTKYHFLLRSPKAATSGRRATPPSFSESNKDQPHTPLSFSKGSKAQVNPIAALKARIH
jgi:hypothetical protein